MDDVVTDAGTTATTGPLLDGTEVEFPAGLPGFPAARRFRLEALGENLRPFRRLHHLADPDISFTVVEPGHLYPDYTIEIDDEHQESLGIDSADHVVTLLMITVPPPPQPPTANLLGPLVVNRMNGRAAQVVQHKSDYKVAEPLSPA